MFLGCFVLLWVVVCVYLVCCDFGVFVVGGLSFLFIVMPCYCLLVMCVYVVTFDLGFVLLIDFLGCLFDVWCYVGLLPYVVLLLCCLLLF